MLGSTALAQAASAASRSPVTSIKIDADRSGAFARDISDYVSSWSIDRSLTTDVPDNARLVSGYVVTQLTLTAAGDKRDNAKDAAWSWSTYNTASGTPLYGALSRIGTPVKVTVGLGSEMVPIFTGSISSIDLSADGGQATITCLDGSEKLRNKIRVPQMVGDYVQVNYSTGNVRQGLNGGRLIDYLFRANGLYSSPPPRTGCVLSVPAHGSLEPDFTVTASGDYTQYGSINYAWDGPGVGIGGNYSMSLVDYTDELANDPRTGTPNYAFGQCPEPHRGISAGWTFRTPVNYSSGASVTLECWVDLSNPDGVAASAALISWVLPVAPASGPSALLTVGFMGDGRPFIQNNAGTRAYGKAPTTSPLSWVYCLVTIVSAASSTQASFTLNGTAPTSGNGRVVTIAGGFDQTATFRIPSIRLEGDAGCHARWEALQVTNESSPPSNFSFTPTAVIEPSLNSLFVVPYSADAQDSWALLQELASVEFGMVFFDETGLATFWNRNHFRNAAQPVTTVSTDRTIESLSLTEDVATIINHVILTATPYTVLSGGWVYQLGQTVGVHSKSTFTYVASFDSAAANVNTSMTFIPIGGNTAGLSGYRACRSKDGNGAAVDNLQITITPYAQTAKVKIYNPNTFPAYIVSPAFDSSGNQLPVDNVGRNMLWLWGQSIVQAQQSLASAGQVISDDTATTSTFEVLNQQSINLNGEQAYEPQSSSYLQDYRSVQGVSQDICDALSYAFPQLTNLTIAAVPGLQLGDRVTVFDVAGTMLNDDFWVTGISTTFDPTQGFSQSLTLRPTAGPGAWVLGKSRLGVDTVLTGRF